MKGKIEFGKSYIVFDNNGFQIFERVWDEERQEAITYLEFSHNMENKQGRPTKYKRPLTTQEHANKTRAKREAKKLGKKWDEAKWVAMNCPGAI